MLTEEFLKTFSLSKDGMLCAKLQQFTVVSKRQEKSSEGQIKINTDGGKAGLCVIDRTISGDLVDAMLQPVKCMISPLCDELQDLVVTIKFVVEKKQRKICFVFNCLQTIGLINHQDVSLVSQGVFG